MEWFRLFNKKTWIIILSILCLNMAFFAYGELNSDRKVKGDEWYIKQKENYVQNYNETIQHVFENAGNMREQRIFAKQNSFSYNNIVRTEKDFNRIKNVSITVSDDRAIEAFFDYNLFFYCVFAIMIIVIYNMFLERENGMWQLAHGLKYGRIRLAVRRIFIITGSSGLILGLFYAVILLESAILYGGVGNMTAPVQEAVGFMRYTYPVSKWQYIVCLFLVSWFVLAALSLCVWSIFTIVRVRNYALVGIIIVIGVEFLLQQTIEPQSIYNGLYYLNIVSFLNVHELLTTYLNWGFKTFVCSKFSACMIILSVLSVILVNISVVRYESMYPSAGISDGIISKIINRLTLCVKKIQSKENIFLMELHKVFITAKGLWVVIAMLVLCIYFCSTNRMYYGEWYISQDEHYREYGGEDYSYIQNELKTEQEKLENLKAKKKEIQIQYENGEASDEQYVEASNNVDYQQMILQGMADYSNKLSYLERIEGEYGVHGYLMSDRGYEMLIGEKSYSREFILLLILAIGVMIINNESFAMEYRTGMNTIIHSAKNGRKTFLIRKVITGLVSSSLLTILVYAVDAIKMIHYYDFMFINAPTVSLTFMGENPTFIILHTRLWQFILLRFIIRLILSWILCAISMSLSVVIGKKGNRSILPISIVLVVLCIWLLHIKWTYLW